MSGVQWLQAADPAQAADAAVATFTDAFGADPEGVWAAPGRVNLIGEHLDYNGGPVLPLALPHRTVAAVRRREDDLLRLVSASPVGQEPARWEGRLADVGPGAPSGWAAYLAGVVWALAQAGHAVSGVDVAVVSAVPIAAGLSSSAALESCLAIALADLLGLPTDDAGRAALAAACVQAENVVAGAPTGGMDQAASLRATDGHALLLDTSDGSVQQVPLALAEAGLALLVMDTRAQHSLSDGQYGARRDACERAARLLGVGALAEVAGPGTDVEEVLGQLGGDDEADIALLRRRVRHVVTETTRVHEAVALLRQVGAQGHADRYRRLGRLLDASHTSLRDDYEVSSPELDAVVEAARGAGALGARMTGGGFGGSAVALVETGAAGEVAAAVRAAALGAGHPEPAFLLAEASGGAARVR